MPDHPETEKGTVASTALSLRDTMILQLVVRLTLNVLGGLAYLFFFCFGWPGIRLLSFLTAQGAWVMKKRFRKILTVEIERLKQQMPNWRADNGVVKKTITEHYSRHVETLFLGALTRKNLDQLAYAQGMEHIDKALSHSRGVILLLSHFGSFLLPLPYLGFREYEICQITGKQNHEEVVNERMWPRQINEEIWRWRKLQADRLPVTFIQVNTFLRPVYNALKANKIIAIAFDGRESSKWEKVSFLGGDEFFSPGPFELARRTGAKIIPTFVSRDRDGSHVIIFEKPFEMSGEKDIDKANHIDTENYACKLGEYIKKQPCHFIVHFPYIRKPFLTR